GLILELENGTITQQINQGIPAIFGIWGPPNSETVYFVGDTNKGGVLLQLQGDTLEQKEIGPVPDLTAIWGSSAEDFYIAGHDATLLHCNSQSCSKVEEILKFLPYQSMFPFFTVNGTDPQDIFVGGDSDKDGSGIILHFDGEQWTKMDVPTSLLASITGIWAKTPQEAYAIDTPSYVYYYNGCTWQTMANFKSLKVGNFWGLWGAENGELFVATGGGDILHYKPPK
ncbi:hypothetical protein HYX14_01870, partial [Candidatus Woesearchaeota archaeon]|nr:hypothetical protein [Candidatus Woesearchaeota archaeon]